MKPCPHCKSPLSVMCVCRRCLTEVDPFPTWYFFAAAAVIVVMGMFVGFGLAL